MKKKSTEEIKRNICETCKFCNRLDAVRYQCLRYPARRAEVFEVYRDQLACGEYKATVV